MFNKNLDYDALWDEIENELDTDVVIDDFQEGSSKAPFHHYQHTRYPYPYQHAQYPYHCHNVFHPLHFIFFPHRRNFH
ncbi:hypothetical protein [Shimazuella alba]|uniref:Uncharacterized protein n=1 Tax=Shimazuella alba TaxID=2690964 RepID=A0A6I4VRT2_9BACL|nr:hypothetical protein [Shimazuella alba]MXQ52510.1 hypothetical protein [Shimazuella alba]